MNNMKVTRREVTGTSYEVVCEKENQRFLLTFTFLDTDENDIKESELDTDTKKLFNTVINKMMECENLEDLYYQLNRLDRGKLITDAIEYPNTIVIGNRKFKDKDYILSIETLLKND